MDNGAMKIKKVFRVKSVPFLLAELRLSLKPAQESWVCSQTVAVTGRLEQLDLSDHLKLLQRHKEGCSE